MLEELQIAWARAKNAEDIAKADRLEIEKHILALSNINTNQKGAHDLGDLKISVSISQTVDSKRLQEVANEKGFGQYLSSLFSWKPSIIQKAWDQAPDEVKLALGQAITSKPSKPNFKLNKKEEN